MFEQRFNRGPSRRGPISGVPATRAFLVESSVPVRSVRAISSSA